MESLPKQMLSQNCSITSDGILKGDIDIMIRRGETPDLPQKSGTMEDSELIAASMATP